MEIQTREEMKIMKLAAYAISEYGADGCNKFNNTCTCLTTAKSKDINTLKTEVDNASISII